VGKEIILLKTLKEQSEFTRKIHPKIKNKIEYKKFLGYERNKILITAEHAKTKKILKPKYGKNAFIGIGDKNTDKLARLAAFYIGGAYLIPKILRTEVDLSRPPKMLDKNMKLFVKLFNADDATKISVPIHRDKKQIGVIVFFHNLISRLNPKVILSYHGMHIRNKPDIFLGFGPNRKYIGGTKNALKFRNFYKEKLEEILDKLGFDPLDIKIGKKLFTGTQNFTLYKHVYEFNKKQTKEKDKRVGIHVEFNLRGRIRKSTNELPKLRYQIAAQVLAECAKRWIKGNI